MITISGIDILPGGNSAPTLYDIGYSLSQVPRFVGHTQTSWSVLQHSYAAATYAKALGWSARMQLLALLHDAHESVISDIPTGWKTPDMRKHQEELDRRIFTSLGIDLPDALEAKQIKQIDTHILAAEQTVLRHKLEPTVPEAIDAVKFAGWGVARTPNSAAHSFEDLVNELLRRVVFEPA